jgi:hypothetical protein
VHGSCYSYAQKSANKANNRLRPRGWNLFQLQSIQLYQPEIQVQMRLMDGGTSFPNFVRNIEQELLICYQRMALKHNALRTLIVGIAPVSRIQGWLVSDTSIVEEETEIRAMLYSLVVPEVTIGPVVFALHFSLGEPAPAEQEELVIPEAWKRELVRAGTDLAVDEIVQRLLDNQPLLN